MSVRRLFDGRGVGVQETAFERGVHLRGRVERSDQCGQLQVDLVDLGVETVELGFEFCVETVELGFEFCVLGSEAVIDLGEAGVDFVL